MRPTLPKQIVLVAVLELDRDVRIACAIDSLYAVAVATDDEKPKPTADGRPMMYQELSMIQTSVVPRRGSVRSGCGRFQQLATLLGPSDARERLLPVALALGEAVQCTVQAVAEFDLP